MTATSSGVGGNVGGPMQPQQRELEASAWTLVNKAALGIMPDTLEVPFSQLGGNVWKYNSDANRPTLKPLGTSRTSVPDEDVPDESWKGGLKDLLSKMHPELSARLLANMEKPFEARDKNYSILENALMLAAKGLAWLSKAQGPTDPESPEGDRLLQNLELPGKALHGALSQGKTLLASTQAFLQFVGPNHPDHDALQGFLKQGTGIQKQLTTLLQMASKGNIPTEAQMTLLANKANALCDAFNYKACSTNLQMLGPGLEAMALVASALSITPAAPTLFLGLKMATMGLLGGNTALGLSGESLEALIKALTKGMGSSQAKKMLLLMMALGMITSSTTLGALISEYGAGRFPTDSEGDEEEGHVFTFQLLLEMVARSGLLTTCYKYMVEVCGGDEKAQQVFADALELISILLIALEGGKKDFKKAARLLEGMKDSLKGKVEKLEVFMMQQIKENVQDPKVLKLMDLGLKQAVIAIEKEDFETLLTTALQMINLLDLRPDQLMDDLDELKDFAKLLKHSCVAETRSSAITGMIRAA